MQKATLQTAMDALVEKAPVTPEAVDKVSTEGVL